MFNLSECYQYRYPCSSPKQMRMYLLGVEPERVPLVHQVVRTKLGALTNRQPRGLQLNTAGTVHYFTGQNITGIFKSCNSVHAPR